jgi:hypothetical protein
MEKKIAEILSFTDLLPKQTYAPRRARLYLKFNVEEFSERTKNKKNRTYV